MVEVRVAGAPLVLLAERAAYLPDHATLLIADAHFGKARSFRKLGVPVPSGTTTRMLARLQALCAATDARRIVFLGDLLHAGGVAEAETARAFVQWREAHARLDLTLVRGNHDARAGDPPADWGLTVIDASLPLEPFVLQHEPAPHDAGYVLAGHVHPCAWIGGRGHDRLRLPCFHFGAAVGVLPAFGEFTGMHALARDAEDRVWVIAGDEVRALAHRIR